MSNRTAVIAVIVGNLLGIGVYLGAEAKMSPELAAEWGDIPKEWGPWFRGVHSPQGVPCCNISDGHRTGYEIRSVVDPRTESGYWVRIKGEWMPVPPEAVVRNSKNPTGEAIVWYVQVKPDKIFVRCFVRDAET